MKLIDTFSAAQTLLSTSCNCSAADSLAQWERYISAWPILREKCQAEYGDKWQEIYATRVFPNLCRDGEKIGLARNNLLTVLPRVLERCTRVFGCLGEINTVIYIGLGNGAGWVTDYAGAPSILFGLENIADLNWADTEALEYLVAHELCHVAHQVIYGKEQWLALDEDELEGAYSRLYIEGFAERYQELILGRPVFSRYGEHWLTWCRANHKRLAAMYLGRICMRKSVADFYGNWNQVEGHSDVGYYLGREFVLYLEAAGLEAADIATLPREKIRQFVELFLVADAAR